MSVNNEEMIIKVEGLYKKFCRSLRRSMYYGSIDIFRDMLGIPYDQSKLRQNEFWALEDIGFELRKGETLGILGINGSGKSTLLRLLTGIFPPDRGKILVKGRVGSLIAVGAGFHPYMTGRENIFLNGTILGMTKKEIQERFNSIVDFADIGGFLDAPVSTYSSGMRVRLGFAIAVHSNPDILLVDEILSVGDLSFRNKCLRYMATFREKAKGIIFVSHNLEQVRVLCSRVIIMEKGKLIYDGPTHKGCVLYEEMVRKMRLDSIKKEESQICNIAAIQSRQSSGEEIEFLDIGLLNLYNQKTEAIGMNESLTFYCDFSVKKPLEDLYFSVGILNEAHKPCIWVMSNDDHKKMECKNIREGKYRLSVKIASHHLIPSVYIPNIAIRNNKTGETYERILPSSSFRVTSDDVTLERGIVHVLEEWKLNLM